MGDVDLPVYPYDSFYKANRARSYRDRVKAGGRAFVDFIQSNGLAARELVKPGTDLPTTLCVMESDLTAEGRELVGRVLDRWLGARDRGGDPSNVAMLLRELQLMRKSRLRESP